MIFSKFAMLVGGLYAFYYMAVILSDALKNKEKQMQPANNAVTEIVHDEKTETATVITDNAADFKKHNPAKELPETTNNLQTDLGLETVSGGIYLTAENLMQNMNV